MINEHTKLIARLHTMVSPRTLNIYNPYFAEAHINAVYLLFYNPDPKPLIEGMRALNLTGAIAAGFESNTQMPQYLDELDDESKYIGKIGFITNRGGILKGYNTQSGGGIHKTIEKASSIADKKMVIVGAGNITKALLYKLSKSPQKPKEVQIYNRTVEKAERLKSDFDFVTKVGSLDKVSSADGDILVNLSRIGGAKRTLFLRVTS